MLAFNLKTFNCPLHNFRLHPWVTVSVRLWKSACRLIITWTRAVSKEQWIICPFYPEQPVKIQTDQFLCFNQWLYFGPRIYPWNRSTLWTLARQSVQLSRWRSDLQQFNSTFESVLTNKQFVLKNTVCCRLMRGSNQGLCNPFFGALNSMMLQHRHPKLMLRVCYIRDAPLEKSCTCKVEIFFFFSRWLIFFFSRWNFHMFTYVTNPTNRQRVLL